MRPGRGIPWLSVGLCVGVAALVARPVAATAPITLRWTAPGDDGLIGRAQTYDLRRSSAPITEASFDAATPILGLPDPGPAGTIETFVVQGPAPDSVCFFAIKAVDEAGNRSALSNVLVVPPATLDARERAARAWLSPPWPNPARRVARLAFTLPEAGVIRAEVFDLRGRRLRSLASGPRPAASGTLTWDLADDAGHPVAAGVYFVRARLGGRTLTRRLVVTR